MLYAVHTLNMITSSSTPDKQKSLSGLVSKTLNCAIADLVATEHHFLLGSLTERDHIFKHTRQAADPVLTGLKDTGL